jgi:hypothetical protein
MILLPHRAKNREKAESRLAQWGYRIFHKQTFAIFFHPRNMPLRPDWCAVPRSDVEVRAELIQLLEKQMEVLELASFVSLTDAELSEYQKRRERISELVEELSTLKTAA